MAVSAVSAVSQPSASASSAASLADNFDTFLKLLTAQLRNQDPLEPMDSSEFTRQLVEFSGVEQAINTNKNLETLIALVSGQGAGSAVGLIGRNAVADTSIAALAEGQAGWRYDLPREASTVTLTVINGAGRVVYTGTGETAAGEQHFTWNGLDNAGAPLPDGLYKLAVTAQDANGGTMAVPVLLEGRVTAADLSGDEPELLIGGTLVPLSKVLQVTEADIL